MDKTLGFFPDGIFFDLDGTLWDSVHGVSTAWQRAVSRYPELHIRFNDDDVRGCMGLCIDDIARRLIPGVDEAERVRIMDECLEEEHRYLRQVGGKVYPHVEETLATLADRCPLFIASNCEQGYIENFLELTGYGKYFRDHISFGDTNQRKGPNTRLLMERHGLKQPIFVGDAGVDRRAAAYVGIPFVWARYGFGQLEPFDYVIDDIRELLPLLGIC